MKWLIEQKIPNCRPACGESWSFFSSVLLSLYFCNPYPFLGANLQFPRDQPNSSPVRCSMKNIVRPRRRDYYTLIPQETTDRNCTSRNASKKSRKQAWTISEKRSLTIEESAHIFPPEKKANTWSVSRRRYCSENILWRPFRNDAVNTLPKRCRRTYLVRNVSVAMMLRRESLGSPQSPCPLVQPLPSLVPRPTRKPDTTNPVADSAGAPSWLTPSVDVRMCKYSSSTHRCRIKQRNKRRTKDEKIPKNWKERKKLKSVVVFFFSNFHSFFWGGEGCHQIWKRD